MCPAGTYGNHPLRYNCSTCIEGYYCPAGTIGPFINPCPVGYYCPAGVAAAVSSVHLFHLFISIYKYPKCRSILAIFLVYLRALEISVNSTLHKFYSCKMTKKGPKPLDQIVRTLLAQKLRTSVSPSSRFIRC